MKKYLWILLVLLLTLPALADDIVNTGGVFNKGSLTIKNANNSVNGKFNTLIITNNSALSDNGDGSVSLSTASGGSGGSGTNFTRSIGQVAHGFATGDVARLSSGSYVKAKADSSTNAEVVGIVSSYDSADTFNLTYGGFITGLSGFSSGQAYFLSDSTAGALTTVEPSTVGHISKPLFIASNSTSGYFYNFRGMVVGTNLALEKDFTISYPITTDTQLFWSPQQAVTITNIHCSVSTATSATMNVTDGSNATESIVCPTGTGGDDDGSIVNANYGVNSQMSVHVSAVSGSPTALTTRVSYKLQ